MYGWACKESDSEYKCYVANVVARPTPRLEACNQLRLLNKLIASIHTRFRFQYGSGHKYVGLF